MCKNTVSGMFLTVLMCMVVTPGTDISNISWNCFATTMPTMLFTKNYFGSWL